MLNQLVITQSNTCFIIEYKDQKLYVLGNKALVYNLKKVFGFDMTAIASIQHVLISEPSVVVEMSAVGKAS